MLVKHLIRELQKCDPEAEVTLEFDGVGDTYCVQVDKDGKVEILTSCFFDKEIEADQPGVLVARFDNRRDTPHPL